MTVKLKGKDGRPDVTEENVEELSVKNGQIEMSYKKPYKWGIVCGVGYYTDEYEIVSCEC